MPASPEPRALPLDAALRARAAAVVPGGMWGHLRATGHGPSYPQFIARADGCRLWDVDGNEYLDFMCAWGPNLLGYRHPVVEAAARAQAVAGDTLNGPGPVMVELAEELVRTVAHADWAMFSKNGTDATTTCVTIARAATGRRKVLAAKGAYHGAAPWCTPSLVGVTAEGRAHLAYYRYNDLDSVTALVEEHADDLACILVSPFRHDAWRDQELPTVEFARGLRALCDRTGAALVLDEVRAGFRMALGGSWEPLGVAPDLSAWSKGIANGHALGAVLGTDRFRDAAAGIYVTGSFWCSAVPMAAALATIGELRATDGVGRLQRAGARLRAGLDVQARAHGFEVVQTGPPQMPFLRFADDDRTLGLGHAFGDEAIRRGVYLHPWHNWFTCAAHTDADVDAALDRTDDAFAALAARRPSRHD